MLTELDLDLMADGVHKDDKCPVATQELVILRDAHQAVREAIQNIEADLMGNADDRRQGDFVLVEWRRVERLFDALMEGERRYDQFYAGRG